MMTMEGNNKDTIFILLSRVPYPLEKGDKLRAYYQIRDLSEHFNIILFAFYENQLHPNANAEISKYCKLFVPYKLNWFSKAIGLIYALFSGLPFQTGFFYSRRAKKAINKLLNSEKPNLVYVQLVRVANYLENYPITKVLDLQDALSENMLRRANNEKYFKNFFFRIEYNRIKKYEASLVDKYDCLTIISSNDKQKINSIKRKNIIVVPNGVDFKYYAPIVEEKKYSVSFIGNMGYAPNIDAALFLVNEIMPMVWEKLPNANVVIAGANPSHSVLKLASSNVLVTGWVEDIRLYYAQSKVFVAPLRIGSGMQNKILEAMSMNVPCITTKISAEPINASNKKEILVAETAQEFAELILELLNFENKKNTLIDNAQIFVNQNYNWKLQTEKLVQLMKMLV